ncbi:MAG: hypothetical protein ABFD50_04950 [Smithella sp.]
MKELGFKKEKAVGYYLDPFNNFQVKQFNFEIRYDEITGVSSRILPYRAIVNHKPDIDSYLEKSPESLCPFCSELFEKLTPKFTPDILPAGRFQRDNAYLFPNAFPYAQNNSIAIFSSSRHFVPMNDLTPGFMRNGFKICGDYFHRLAEMNSGYRYCSLNWNYMPPSGGGQLHPHMQTLAGLKPTNYMQRLLNSAQNYVETSGDNLWRNLIMLEKEAKERFIASTGSISWLVSFAPKGMAGEIDFIFQEKTSFFELTEANFDELLKGLSKIFGYLYLNNFLSFNMSIYAPLISDKNFWVQGKIVPRFETNPLATSDINYLEKLHNEIICAVVPEELCCELQPYFS